MFIKEALICVGTPFSLLDCFYNPYIEKELCRSTLLGSQWICVCGFVAVTTIQTPSTFKHWQSEKTNKKKPPALHPAVWHNLYCRRWTIYSIHFLALIRLVNTVPASREGCWQKIKSNVAAASYNGDLALLYTPLTKIYDLKTINPFMRACYFLL